MCMFSVTVEKSCFQYSTFFLVTPITKRGKFTVYV